MNTINTILKRGLVALLAIFVSVGTVHAQEIMTHSHGIFFSEYIEGGGNNKAFEIFNSTDDDIDLGNYIVLGNYNGNPFNDTLRFPVGTMLASMDVFVVAHEGANSEITAVADSLIQNPYDGGSSYIAVFNGDESIQHTVAFICFETCGNSLFFTIISPLLTFTLSSSVIVIELPLLASVNSLSKKCILFILDFVKEGSTEISSPTFKSPP